MSAKSDKQLIDELRHELRLLYKDLKFEKKLNSLLENIRNFSLILYNNCECKQNTKYRHKLQELNANYSELKAEQSLDDSGIYRSSDS